MLRLNLFLIILLSALLAGGSIAFWALAKDNGDNEEMVPLTDVPKEVLDAANSAVSGGEITAVEMETEDGLVIYDVTKVVDGVKYEIEITADGVVKEIEKEGDDNDKEEEIALSDLPPNVSEAANKAVPDGRIVEAEKKDENGEVIYEVEMIVKHVATVTAKGEVKKVEIEKEDDNGDNDKDDEKEDDD